MDKKDPYWLRMLTITVLALIAWACTILIAWILWQVGKFLISGWLHSATAEKLTFKPQALNLPAQPHTSQ